MFQSNLELVKFKTGVVLKAIPVGTSVPGLPRDNLGIPLFQIGLDPAKGANFICPTF